jgi:hypothetical protein
MNHVLRLNFIDEFTTSVVGKFELSATGQANVDCVNHEPCEKYCVIQQANRADKT